jgi:hypothetical protein
MIGNVDLDLIEKTYQNASIGITALEAVLDKTKNVELNNALHRQLKDYNDIIDISKEQLKVNGAQVKDNPMYEKVLMKGNVKMNTMMNSSDSHIAQMIIQGSTMGITTMTKLLNAKSNADGISTEIAKDFIRREQLNIEEMKKFL